MNIDHHSLLTSSLHADTYAFCQPEGRVVGTPGHAAAERFLLKRVKEIGLEPYRGNDFALPYTWGGQSFTNIVAVVPGRDLFLEPLLIGAHYDSVIEAPCADDNGAAVAICLALAEMAMEQGGFNRDLVVAFFDAEEPPFFNGPGMGSNVFGDHQLDARDVHFAMIYDLVGHDLPVSWLPYDELEGRDLGVPALKDIVFMTGAESHADLPRILDRTPLPERLKVIATLNRYIGDMSDHGIFRRSGNPYLFFSCGRWDHYHEPTDTPDRLNYEKMARLAQHSFDILRRVDDEILPAKPSEDPVAFEANTFRRSTGMLFPVLCEWAGVDELDDREALDRVVERILATGLG